MNNAYNFDEYGNVISSNPRKQHIANTQTPQYEVPSWRRAPAPRNPASFPPLDMIGSDANTFRSRMAPPMDRNANRSRSPLNADRRLQDYRSRTPPNQHSTSFGTPPRPQISYPRPFYPEYEEVPPRFALRSESPPRYPRRERPSPPQSRVPYPTEEQTYPRPSPPQSRLPYPTEERASSRSTPPQTRAPYPLEEQSSSQIQPPVSPVSRSSLASQEVNSMRPSRTYDYALPVERTRPSAGPISDVTKDLVPKPKAKREEHMSTIRVDLVPKPLNFRSNTPARKEIISMCEYLSLDELENLWESQDMYSGTITAPATKPCSPMYGMAPVGPMSPSLADHPAFRNEHQRYNGFACA